MFKHQNTFLPAFDKNNVPVVFAANNLYAPYAGVFIQSLLDNAKEQNNYDIIILQRNISEENKRVLKSMAFGHSNVSIRFYDPSPLFESFNYVDEEHSHPLEIYYKIIAPHILGYSGKIIVVDIDTLLMTDIALLMDEELGECCVGGVSNAAHIYAVCLSNRAYAQEGYIKAQEQWRNHGISDWTDVNSYKDHMYGGLHLFDSNRYVQKVPIETILHAAWQNEIFITDDCLLSNLTHGNIKLLDLSWNVVLPLNLRAVESTKIASKIYDETYNDNEAYKRAYQNPYMLHWGSRPKPWVCPDVPYGSEWWQTALRTPFVGHIIARMLDAQAKRKEYYRERYRNDNVDIWDPSPKGIDRTKQ